MLEALLLDALLPNASQAQVEAAKLAVSESEDVEEMIERAIGGVDLAPLIVVAEKLGVIENASARRRIKRAAIAIRSIQAPNTSAR